MNQQSSATTSEASTASMKDEPVITTRKNMNHLSPATTSEASTTMPVKDEPVITSRKNYSNAKPLPLRHKTENDLVSVL